MCEPNLIKQEVKRRIVATFITFCLFVSSMQILYSQQLLLSEAFPFQLTAVLSQILHNVRQV